MFSLIEQPTKNPEQEVDLNYSNSIEPGSTIKISRVLRQYTAINVGRILDTAINVSSVLRQYTEINVSRVSRQYTAINISRVLHCNKCHNNYLSLQ